MSTRRRRLVRCWALEPQDMIGNFVFNGALITRCEMVLPRLGQKLDANQFIIIIIIISGCHSLLSTG